MKEFEKERKILEQENAHIDNAINLLSKIKIRDVIKSKLLNSARETKAVIANLVRLIDGF